MTPMARRTPTSYTVLGLLALEPKSGYELVQGYARSVGQIGSRSDAVLYNEPKRLMADGLVSAVEEQRGKRTVAVYSITDEGLDVLRGWLAEPPEFPILDAEPVIRSVFSDFGELDDLRATITAFRDEAQARLDVNASLAGEYFAGRGAYPDRIHIVTLSGRFVGFLFTAYVDWCDWALASLDDWPDDTRGRHEWAHRAVAQYLTDLGHPPDHPSPEPQEQQHA